MTREEQNRKLKAFITCLKCEVSGKPCDDNCPTQYEAGNMGEIIENLETISRALEQEPKNCSDCEIVQACVEAGIRSTSRALSILDQIRAEIESLKRFEIRGEKTPLINGNNVLAILNKYKVESEPQESEDKE